MSVHTKLYGLYAITDTHLIPRKRFVETVEAAVRGGATMVQLREKETPREELFAAIRQVRGEVDVCAGVRACPDRRDVAIAGVQSPAVKVSKPPQVLQQLQPSKKKLGGKSRCLARSAFSFSKSDRRLLQF